MTTHPSPRWVTALPLCSLHQDLEYPGFEVEDQVWNRLLELRGGKIRKELELKKQQRTFAVMKRKLEALQADCDSVDSQVWRNLPTTVTFTPSFHLGRRDLTATLTYPAHVLATSASRPLLLSDGAMRTRLVNLNSSVNWPGVDVVPLSLFLSSLVMPELGSREHDALLFSPPGDRYWLSRKGKGPSASVPTSRRRTSKCWSS